MEAQRVQGCKCVEGVSLRSIGGGIGKGAVLPLRRFFFIFGCRNAYFGAFSEPSDEHAVDEKF